MQSKAEIRKALRRRRRALSPHAQRLAAQQLARQLRKMPALRKARHIAAYWPNDGEISPIPFLHELQRTGKYIYLPAVLDNGHLRFRRFHLANGLVKNCYGIPEPASKLQRPPQDMDVVLMPLVAFDQHGNRLGMGGGYYDRTFAFKRQQLWRKKPLLLGLAHHFQCVETLHHDSWDIPLGGIVTDQGKI